MRVKRRNALFIIVSLLILVLLVSFSHLQLTWFIKAASNAVEGESATLDGQMTTGTDSTASGNTYIQFHTTPLNQSPTPIQGTAYYIDCGGSDTNSGTSPASAWRNASKASSAPLVAGDGVFFKRGCSWNGVVTISKSGTASSPITISAYGTGGLPVITRNTNGADISVSGSYILIDSLQLTATSVSTISSTDATCPNAPVGNTQGLALENGSHDITLKNSLLTNHYAGVYIKSGSTNNHILSNTFQNNTMMSPLDTATNNDAGAFGVLLWGDDNEIAYNTITGSDACSYDYQRDGSAIEVYGGQRNNVHHNIASNDDAFSELGNSRSSDNIFAYNSFTSTSSHSLFLVTRGSTDTYGPVLRTTLYNNSIYLPQSYKDAIVCYAGCDATVIKLRNNISWGGAGSIYADKTIDEDYNLFNGTVHINGGSTVGAHSVKANPLFVNTGTSDFHLQSTSPAINKGIDVGYTFDLDKKVVPTGSAPDIGAYEF